MAILFTADSHHGHPSILDHAKRQFASHEKMSSVLIKNANMRCKPGDQLLHVGDFMNYGLNKGIEGDRRKPSFYEEQYNAPIVHILGNHDENNGVKFGLTSARMQIGKMRALVQHEPIREVSMHLNYDIVICGHVHLAWKTKWVGHILCINVGVDQWRYNPVTVQDIIALCDKECRNYSKSRQSPYK